MDKTFNLTVLINDEDNIWQIFKTDSRDDPLAHGNMINGSVNFLYSDLRHELVLCLLYAANRGDFGSGNTL